MERERERVRGKERESEGGKNGKEENEKSKEGLTSMSTKCGHKLHILRLKFQDSDEATIVTDKPIEIVLIISIW